MKKIIFLFIASTILFSCSKKEQYYGSWYQYYATSGRIKIQKDSISLSDDGSIWKTYPLKIENNSLTFLNHTFQTAIYKDSLIFEELTYEKDTVNPILEIALPKLENYIFQQSTPEENLVHVRFGKVPNTNEYKLQLNDLYADVEDLIDFFYGATDLSHHYQYPRLLLICDKNAKMEDIAPIYREMVKLNIQILYVVNDVTHNIIDNRIEKKHLSYKQYITPIRNMHYEAKVDNSIATYYNNSVFNYAVFNHLDVKNSQFLYLINNELYVGKEQYNLERFTQKVDSLITEKKQLICLFDLNSDFYHNTIFNAVINDSYQKLFDSVATKKYNTAFSKLSDKEKEKIQDLFPRRNIQNISIPHFLSFEEYPLEDINFPFKNVKDQLPKVYFD